LYVSASLGPAHAYKITQITTPHLPRAKGLDATCSIEQEIRANAHVTRESL